MNNYQYNEYVGHETLKKEYKLFTFYPKGTNIDQNNDKIKLELIGIDYLKNKDNFEINLIFRNNAHIVLTTETIEVRLEDQNEI